MLVCFARLHDEHVTRIHLTRKPAHDDHARSVSRNRRHVLHAATDTEIDEAGNDWCRRDEPTVLHSVSRNVPCRFLCVETRRMTMESQSELPTDQCNQTGQNINVSANGTAMLLKMIVGVDRSSPGAGPKRTRGRPNKRNPQRHIVDLARSAGPEPRPRA